MVRSELIDELLHLDSADRAYVRDVLASTLPGEEPLLTAAEEAEIQRRGDEFLTHPEKFLSWEEVKAMLQERRSRKPA